MWTKYEISPETIEQSLIWKKQNIETSIDNWDTVAKIKLIDSNGQITVVYTYAKKKRIPFFKTSKRKLIYIIDHETGKLKLNKIMEV